MWQKRPKFKPLASQRVFTTPAPLSHRGEARRQTDEDPEFISRAKQDGRADPQPLWLHFPLGAPSIRHGRGQRSAGIHQNSLCSVRYTKEPLRIRGGPLCLRLPTLGPLPSAAAPPRCELVPVEEEGGGGPVGEIPPPPQPQPHPSPPIHFPKT